MKTLKLGMFKTPPTSLLESMTAPLVLLAMTMTAESYDSGEHFAGYAQFEDHSDGRPLTNSEVRAFKMDKDTAEGNLFN